ncbi:hypothetical protein [Saezia sanguinis]
MKTAPKVLSVNRCNLLRKGLSAGVREDLFFDLPLASSDTT